jgi:hypothetical protein
MSSLRPIKLYHFLPILNWWHSPIKALWCPPLPVYTFREQSQDKSAVIATREILLFLTVEGGDEDGWAGGDKPGTLAVEPIEQVQIPWC